MHRDLIRGVVALTCAALAPVAVLGYWLRVWAWERDSPPVRTIAWQTLVLVAWTIVAWTMVARDL